jgi:hypothetical protein
MSGFEKIQDANGPAGRTEIMGGERILKILGGIGKLLAKLTYAGFTYTK